MTRFEDRTSRMLDAALEMTFPASDPIAVSVYEDEDLTESSRDAGAEA